MRCVAYIQENSNIEICSSNGLFTAQTGTISQFFPPEALQSSESLLMSFLWAAMEEGVTAHLRSSLIAAASAAVEWILKVKLGSWESCCRWMVAFLHHTIALNIIY